MGIGTFGSFTQARLAIYAAQTGISVTGNNISNINTPGYTRQRLNQVSLHVAGSDKWYARGDVRAGLGVLAKSISQIRSPYLDIRFREENAKVGYNNAMLEGLNSIANILDEVGKGVDDKEGFGIIAQEINDLIASLQDLVDQTGHQEYDNIVRQVASNLASRLNGYANRLQQVYEDTVNDFNNDVDKVNELLTSIRSYNEEIRRSEIHGDPALELRDERNLLLDELSGLIDIEVIYTEERIAAGLTVEKLTVRLGNANPDGSVDTDEALLIDGIYCAQLTQGKPMKNEYYGLNLEEEDLSNPSEKMQELLTKLGITPDANGDITDAEKEQLELWVSSQYLKAETDDDGNIIPGTEEPVADIRDATVLTGEDNPNYDIMITELRNRIGELHKTTKTYLEKDATGNEPIYTDSEGNPIPNAPVDLATLLKDVENGYYTSMVKGEPERGDSTITVYRKTTAKDGTVTYTMQVYEQLASKPVALDDNDLGGELQAERELLTEKGEFTEVDTVYSIDENAGAKRGIQYYQNALDLLARQLAGIMNGANQGFLTDPKGNYITGEQKVNDEGKKYAVLVTLASGHVLNQNDTFSSLSDDDRKEILAAVGLGELTNEESLNYHGFTGQDVINAYLRGQTFSKNAEGKLELSEPDEEKAQGVFVGGPLFSNSSSNDDPTGITAANISISKTWLTEHILVRDFVCPVGEVEPASGASDNIRHMLYLLDTQKWDFNPNDLDNVDNANRTPMFNGTIYEFWNNIGSTLGKDQDYTNTELTVAYESALSIDTDRSSVSSVDFNDEAMNLMMYSKSYNAACRLMTTIDSMIDKLVNGTGLTT